MNALIQSQLDRVETALNTLIDSISSYNPSPAAALTLVSADDDLTEGLEQLATHQRNHTLLLNLRAQSLALDTRIKSTLSQLAATRSELLNNTPVTIPPPLPPPSATVTQSLTTTSNTIDYATLLSYAARIAKFTVPPTYRPPLPPSIEDGLATTTTTANEAHQQQQPQISTTTITNSPLPIADPSANPTTALSEAQQAWLDPTSTTGQFFTPWPRDESIRRGALAQIQAARDRGVEEGDVENMDLAGQLLGVSGVVNDEEEEEEKRKAQEEREEEEKELRRRRESVSMLGAGAILAGHGQSHNRPKRREEPAREEVFEGFELYNPDE